jgi:V8-like Glu-specific endopeptidase
MKLHHFIRKLLLASLGFTLTLHSSFGSGILSSSLLRRAAQPTTNYIAQKAVVNAVRFCSTIPEGFKLIEFDRKHKAPWLDKKQAKKEEEFLDISQFCADPERGILYRYQSSGNSEEKKEKFPLFKTKISTFDRCADQSDSIDVFNAMGLVESFFDLGNGKSIVTAGTGFLIDSDTVLTAGHNLTLDPKDSTKIKIKTPLKANKVKFFLRYDEGKSSNVFEVSEYKLPIEWESGRDKSYDFAAIFLKQSILETRIKLSTIKKEMKLPIPASIAGYPEEIPTESGFRVKNIPLCSYMHTGELKEISSCRKIIGYNCFTNEGMSGGPILVRGFPIALGVHTRGCLDLNRGVHHFDHMVSYLKKWFSEKDGNQESSSDEIINMISELAKTEEEKTHLISSLDKIKDFQQENLRPYLAAILHVYRK